MIPITALHIVKVDAVLDDAAVVKAACLALGGMTPGALLYGLIEVRRVRTDAINGRLLVHTIIVAEA